MKQLTEIKKKLANDWFKFLQGKIIDEFQLLENEINKKNKTKTKYFIKKNGKNIIKKRVVEAHTF